MTYHVIKTAPQKEEEAKRILERHGYHVNLPVERVWTRGAGGKRKLREVALMTRYLFVRGNINHYQLRNLYCKNGMPIITGFIDGNLPPEIIQRLMAIITPRSAEYHKSLKEGDQVRSGNITGRIIGTRKEQAQVLTQMLGKMHIVYVDVNKLEAA